MAERERKLSGDLSVPAEKFEVKVGPSPSVEPAPTPEPAPAPPTVSEWDVEREQKYGDAYRAAKAKEEKDLTPEDVITIYRYENQPPAEPGSPDYEDAPSYEPAVEGDRHFSNTYAELRRRREAMGDTPAQRVKRAKAHRASRVVAALGDVLQGAANMWAAGRGARSAKLTSMSGELAAALDKERTAELRRDKAYAAELEAARKADDRANAAASREAYRKHSAETKAVGDRNAARRKEYEQQMQNYRRARTAYDAGERAAVNRWHADNQRRMREQFAAEMERTRQENREKLKGMPTYAQAVKSSGGGGGKVSKKRHRRGGGGSPRTPQASSLGGKKR